MPEEWSQLQQPAGQGTYTVSTGECVSKIGYRHGHFWQTIWNHPDNEDLKQQRRDPNVLLSGDKLTIPPIELREASCATEQKHRFRKKTVPAVLRVVLRIGGEPRANETYELLVDGMPHSKGTLDADGKLEAKLPPDAREGLVRVGPMKDPVPLDLCGLDPVDSVAGIQQRLLNLRFDPGNTRGDLTDQTREALMAFQSAHELDPTGKPDQATLDKLKQVYGC
jgi:hypothetical protein